MIWIMYSSRTRIKEAKSAKYSNQNNLPMTGTRAMVGNADKSSTATPEPR